MGFLSDLFGGGGGDDAADAAIRASETQAESQREALDYLRETNRVPQGFREEALTQLGGLYGLEGGLGSQEELIQRAIESPLYRNIMSGLDVGEESILRNAAATGGLRSGDASYNLADYNTRLQNQALLQSYNQELQGLQGLAGLSTNENQIAQLISSIGTTLGQGQIAAAGAQQAGSQNRAGNLMGLGQLGIEGYQSGLFSDIWGGIKGMFSDRRLKKNIEVLGQIKGFNWCSFEWNSVAEKLGLQGKTCGIMADEVFETVPDAVILKDGFMFVLYDLLGFSTGATQ